MPGPAFLEAFELVPDTREDTADTPTEDWVEGHAAGYAQGLSDAAQEQARLSDDLVQSLNDQAFAFFEAKDHILRTLRPMFDALIGAFVPELARTAMKPKVIEALLSIADDQTNAPIVVTVSPGLLPVLDGLGERIDDHPLRITTDPELTDDQAIVSGAEQEIVVDLGTILREAQDILGALGDATQRKAHHG